jgi:hypothetical protein
MQKKKSKMKLSMKIEVKVVKEEKEGEGRQRIKRRRNRLAKELREVLKTMMSWLDEEVNKISPPEDPVVNPTVKRYKWFAETVTGLWAG